MFLAKIIKFLGLLVIIIPIGLSILGFILDFILGCGTHTCKIGGEAVQQIVFGMTMAHWFAIFAFFPGTFIFLFGLLIEKMIIRYQPKTLD